MKIEQSCAFVILCLALPLTSGCASAPSEPIVEEQGPLPFPPQPVQVLEDYVVGVGDELSFQIRDLEKIREATLLFVDVEADGTITLPVVGKIRASGLTVPALREAVASAFASYVVDPAVFLSVREYRSHKLVVTGAVGHPGPVHLHENTASIIEVLALAGGLSGEAGTVVVVVPPAFADQTGALLAAKPIEIDLMPLLDGGDPSYNVRVRPGSYIHVPKAREYSVTGYVARPGSFPYQRPTTLTRAISVAGGLDVRKASPGAVEIRHRTPHGVEIFTADLNEIARGEMPDVKICPGDSIYAGRTLPWAIYTEIVDTALGGLGAAVGIFAGTR